jgi:putative DNA primase/helicase
VPVPYGTKHPTTDGWQDKLYEADDLEAVFGRRTNNGILLGTHSDNTLDVDLDALCAHRVARRILPPTGMVWGRSRKPASHWLYRMLSTDGVRYKKFNDPTPKEELDRFGLKACLLELRFSGRQSLAPGSVNTEDGVIDPVRWEPDATGERGDIDWGAIYAAGERLSAVMLAARYWRNGERHDASLPLSGLCWYGGMSIDDALAFVENVCIAAGDHDVENRLTSVRDTYQKGDHGSFVSGGPTLAEDHFTEAVVRQLRKWLHLKAKRDRGMLGPDGLPLESDGDADRFAARWAGEVLYCAEEKCWYSYNEVVWERDRTESIKERAKTVVREFRALVGAKASEPNVYGVGGVAEYDKCALYAVRMGSEARILAMLELARSKPELAVKPEQFDADPLMFNVLDCTLDLNTTAGKVSSHLHNPHDLIRRVALAHYRPAATHPLIEQALTRFHPEEDHQTFLADMGGYCLTGLPKRHGLQLIGPHDSGKSTFLAMFRNTWNDYGASLADTNLAKNPHKGGDIARPDLLRVKDARIVTVPEVDPDTKFDVALFKIIHSGGDATHLRNFFDKGGGGNFTFHCSIWMSGNKEYGMPADESAAYDRIEVLDCDHQVPETAREEHEERATTDPAIVGDAVLAMAIRGFERLYGSQRGILHPPASAVQAKKEVRNSRDPFSTAIDKLFVVTNDPTDGIKKSEAWSVMRDYIQGTGEWIQKPRALQKAFEDALKWRVGAFTHSSSRFAGLDYWPGLRWSDAARARWGVTMPDWEAQ